MAQSRSHCSSPPVGNYAIWLASLVIWRHDGSVDRSGSINDGFVQAIHAERAARHLSQAELARRLGIFPATLSGWIGPNPVKRTAMTTEVVHRIARVLGVDVAYLATEALIRTGRREARQYPPSP